MNLQDYIEQILSLIHILKAIVDKVAQAHESDGVVELTTAKSMIAKNAEVSDTVDPVDRKSTRLNSSHSGESRMPSSA